MPGDATHAVLYGIRKGIDRDARMAGVADMYACIRKHPAQGMKGGDSRTCLTSGFQS